jgi:hypothetical protein
MLMQAVSESVAITVSESRKILVRNEVLLF